MNHTVAQDKSTVRKLLESQARRYGDKEFLFFPEKDQTFTYRHYDEMTSRTANLLLSLGVKKGDKVAIMLPNIPEFLYFYWGCMKIGVVAGPINTLLKGPEVQYITHN
jgi:long-chain acyl-CoA synthetase